MKAQRRIAAVATAAALGLVPAVAFAQGGNGHGSSTGHGNPAVYGESHGGANAKKYGRMCAAQGESKKHVAGQKGTPFSNCVKALAQVAKNSSESTSQACKAANESKKHVAGQSGTPYSDCVKAAAHLRSSERSHSSSSTSSTA